jgi:prepilin-type N-terminal cleavage/methylation domain-containing protein
LRRLCESAREDDGFSLVEAIVALAILALVITSALEVLGSGGIRQRMDEQRATALAHAQSELAVINVRGLVQAGMTAGAFDDGYSWRLSAIPLEMAPDVGQALVPHAITIEVGKSEDYRHAVRLRTVVLARHEQPKR